MPDTTTVEDPPTRRRPPTWRLGAVVLSVLVVAGLALVALTVQDPARVDRMSVVNPTDYELSVVVDTGSSTRPLALVPAGETYELTDVLDEGDTWTLGFAAQGVDAGTVTVERGDPDADFEVVVPDEVGERLEAEGVVPVAG